MWLKIIGIRPSEFNLVFKPGDNIWGLVTIKNIRTNGWFNKNLQLGYPDYQNLSLIPSVDWFHLILIKILTIFIENNFITFTVFMLIINTLTGISMYVASRYYLNVFYSLVFTSTIVLSPWRLERYLDHSLLANLTPLACSLILGNLLANQSMNRKTILNNYVYPILLIAIISTSGMYWIFLSTITLLIFLFANMNKLNIRIFALIVTFISSVGMSFGLNFLNYDKNVLQNFKRLTVESEIYGGKLQSLFLPSSNSGIDLFNLARQKINSAVSSSFEGNANLTIIGVLGSYLILFIIIVNLQHYECYKKFYQVRLLSITWFIVLLIFISSGFGTLFAYYISPQIRATGRFSIYLMIISSLIFLHFLQNIRIKGFKYLFSTIIIILSLLELNSSNYRVNTIDNILFEKEIQSFVNQIENESEGKCIIYQLPYSRFPENPQIHKLQDYELFWPYLFSENLVFSYGAVKGTDIENSKIINKIGDRYQNLKVISNYNFCGVLLDSRGFEDSDLVDLEMKLKSFTDGPLSSTSGRWKFYSLS
jgi:phosphoglycerol transferase